MAVSGEMYEQSGPYLMSSRVPGTGLVCVVFHWDSKHGPCRDCGLPAAYLVDPDGAMGRKACAVCAAEYAAAGERIDRLDNEE